eukprot:261056-Pelagomonas_calceolata.AAC.3
MQGSQGDGSNHSNEESGAAGAANIAAAVAAPLPLSLPLTGSTAVLAASLPMLLGLPCLNLQHFIPHTAAAAAAAAAFAGGSGACTPVDATSRCARTCTHRVLVELCAHVFVRAWHGL